MTVHDPFQPFAKFNRNLIFTKLGIKKQQFLFVRLWYARWPYGKFAIFDFVVME